MSLVHHKDIPVLIAVNEKGVFVIDHVENVSNGDLGELFGHNLINPLLLADAAARFKVRRTVLGPGQAEHGAGGGSGRHVLHICAV